MKSEENESKKIVKVSESALLSLVASKLKDRVLFPQKIEETKQYLKKIKTSI